VHCVRRGLGVIRYQNIWPAFSIIYLLRPRVYLFVNERGALEKTRRPLYGFCVTLQKSLSLSPFACWTSTVRCIVRFFSQLHLLDASQNAHFVCRPSSQGRSLLFYKDYFCTFPSKLLSPGAKSLRSTHLNRKNLYKQKLILNRAIFFKSRTNFLFLRLKVNKNILLFFRSPIDPIKKKTH
jgi:hypothetical protein